MLSLQELAIWNSNGNEELQIKEGVGGVGVDMLRVKQHIKRDNKLAFK